MPTKKPRVNIIIEEETYQALKALNRASGVAMSSICSRLINDAAPTFLKLAEVFATAKKNESAAWSALESFGQGVAMQGVQLSMGIDEASKKRVSKMRKQKPRD